MKQKDYLLIGAVVFISAIISYFASKAIIAPPKNRQQQVEVVQPITTEFNKPSTKYFNSGSFDPTQIIQIGDSQNQAPFNNRQ